MRWLLALLALFLPPVALFKRTRGAVIATALWLGGLAVFFLLAWGVGAMLMVLAGIIAAVVAVRK